MPIPNTTTTKGPETSDAAPSSATSSMRASPINSNTPLSPTKSDSANSSTSTSPTDCESTTTTTKDNNKVNGRNNSSVYTTTFPGLPPNNSTSHAHILSLSTLSNSTPSQVSLQDAVATTLYHTTPTLLPSFLDPTVPVFKAIFCEKKGGSGKKQLVIWRKGVEVLIGTYTAHTSPKRLYFSHVAGYLIGYDGRWHLRATAGNAWVAANRWTDVWTGKFECLGGVERMEVETEEEEMEGRARKLARSVLEERFWCGGVDVKM